MLCFLASLALVHSSFSAELARLVSADQADRTFASTPTKNQLQRMTVGDRRRRKRVREILREADHFSADDFDNAALIFQHGNTPQDFELAHELAICAAGLGKIESLPCLTEDRFLESVHWKQRFGTQFSGFGNSTVLKPVDEQEPTAVTDELRLDLLVPPLEMSKRYGLNAVMKSQDLVLGHVEKRRNPKNSAVYSRGTLDEGSDLENALELYRENEIVTHPQMDSIATSLLHSNRPKDLLLGHEIALVAFSEGDKRAKGLCFQAWRKFVEGLHIRVDNAYPVLVKFEGS